jgi:hypothetical protein
MKKHLISILFLLLTASMFAATPAQMVNVQVSQNGTFADLSWETVTEVNNDYFVVERSTDSITFNQIGTKQGAGTTSNYSYYSFTDSTIVPDQIYYYRLKQVDFGGQSSYSSVVSYMYSTTEINNMEYHNIAISLYPNPSESSITIEFTRNIPSVENKIRIYDIKGQLLINKKVITEKSMIDISKLSAGTYIYEIITGSELINIGKFEKL